MRVDQRDEAGVIAIIVAAMALFLFGLGAIVVDLGYARTLSAEAQDVADAAALAGIQALYPDGGDTPQYADALDAVKESAFDNLLRQYYDDVGDADQAWGNDPGGTMPGSACQAGAPPAGWKRGPGNSSNCILFKDDPTHPPDTIRVIVPVQDSPVFLGGIFGFNGTTISAVAAAGRDVTPIPNCTLCVSGELSVAASGRVEVRGAGLSGTGTTAGSLSVGTLSITNTPSTITVDPPGRVTAVAPLLPPTPLSGSAYSPPQAPVQPWPVTAPTPGLTPPPQSEGPDQGDVTCDDGDPSLFGTYGNLTIVGDCRFRRFTTSVVTVTGTLRILPGASLDARRRTLFLEGPTARLEASGPIQRLGGGARPWSLYCDDTCEVVSTGSSVELTATADLRSGTIQLSSSDIAADGDLRAGAIQLTRSDLVVDGNVVTDGLDLDSTSSVIVTADTAGNLRQHGSAGLVE